MRYIDADILRKEIEKRIKSSESCPFIEAEVGAEERRDGKIRTYNEILVIIDSLQQEQPEVELDQAVKEYFRGHWPDTSTPEGCNATMSFTAPAILRLIKHFTYWQYQKDRAEFAKLKAKEWMSGYDDAISQFVKIPYTDERWFSTTDGEFIAGALFEEPIPADAELYYKKED